MDRESGENNGLKMDHDIKDNKEKKKRWVIEIIIYVSLIILCAFFIPKYVLQRTIIDGDSMETNLSDEENVLVEKVTVKLNQLKRFDVIVFYPFGEELEDYYVKRIIGLPGETVLISDAVIYINGEALKEDFGKDPIVDSGLAREPITLADDEYFVLGDNRSISEDSRNEAIGPVKRANIEGKVILRIWPLSKFGTIR